MKSLGTSILLASVIMAAYGCGLGDSAPVEVQPDMVNIEKETKGLAAEVEPTKEARSGTGLEVKDASRLKVLYSKLGSAGRKILSQDRIKTVVELTLREHGIRPVEVGTVPDVEGALRITFRRNGSAYAIRLRFQRRLDYEVDGVLYNKAVVTWYNNSLERTRFLDSRDEDREVLEQELKKDVELFIAEFLAANDEDNSSD